MDLSIADTSNIRHFLQEICIHFTLDTVLQVSFKFSSIFFILLFSQFKKETLVKVFCCQFCEISKGKDTL